MRISTMVTAIATVLALSASPQLRAQDAGEGAETDARTAAEASEPKLVIAISVDQFSADLFSEYRSHFTGGLKRLSEGAVFPSAYQSHAATETCPGHATILTGVHPGRAGIIANRWFDLSAVREDKRIYCAEDESIAGSSSRNYTASVTHLLVPTLGDRMKSANGAARNVAVSGKDRAALMMGGRNLDAIYWWGGEGFTSLAGSALSAAAQRINTGIATEIANGAPAMTPPAFCASRTSSIKVNEEFAVGDYSFARPANEPRFYRISPYIDAATLSMAAAMVDEQGLGRDDVTDMLSIGLSATDYVGHAFGTQGLEMCLQMAALDTALGEFFDLLDAKGIDYSVMLTADHGGHDLPERLKLQALPDAARADEALEPKALSERVRAKLDFAWEGPIIYGDGPFGDMYVTRDMDDAQRAAAKTAAIEILRGSDQVAAVVTGEELGKMDMPKGQVQNWTLKERARASYHPDRSGDFVVMLKSGITPIPNPGMGYVATHGSPWDYDRRVPLLFWRAGMTGFEQPNAVMTVDIAPTLAAMADVSYEEGAFDGRCLDLDSGAGNSCD